MSLRLKLCLIVSLIYLCQSVQSYTRQKTICTQWVQTTTGSYKRVKSCCNGYTQDPGSLRILRCKPVCPAGCLYGECIAPNVCRCYVGYAINPATFSCEPRCFEPCYNGDCVAPDTCKCRPGFWELNATYCEPISLCSPSCFNGDCVGTNQCQCHDGYKLSGWAGDGFDYTCLPHTTTTTSSTTTLLITSTDGDQVFDYSSETTTKAGSSSPEVTDRDQMITDRDQVVTDQDALYSTDDAETITKPDFTTGDVNEVNASETNVTDGSMTVIVIFGGFTEMANTPKNKNTKTGTNIWIYISAAILLVALVTLLVIAFRRRLLGYIKRRTYVVQGEQTRSASVSSRNFNVTFSSTSNRK